MAQYKKLSQHQMNVVIFIKVLVYSSEHENSGTLVVFFTNRINCFRSGKKFKVKH